MKIKRLDQDAHPINSPQMTRGQLNAHTDKLDNVAIEAIAAARLGGFDRDQAVCHRDVMAEFAKGD
ncbi:MAG: hypothetical protein L0H37_09270 [Nitrosospira sp.]|nr:hypothetical protein [Nitrosospira sp.]